MQTVHAWEAPPLGRRPRVGRHEGGLDVPGRREGKGRPYLAWPRSTPAASRSRAALEVSKVEVLVWKSDHAEHAKGDGKNHRRLNPDDP